MSQTCLHLEEGALTVDPIHVRGMSFGPFEAVFVTGDKKVCVTLLGLVMVSLLATDFVFAPHVINAKLGEIPNYYICFSSSTVALFAVRALFFVLKDWVARFSHMKYGTSCCDTRDHSLSHMGRRVDTHVLESRCKGRRFFIVILLPRRLGLRPMHWSSSMGLAHTSQCRMPTGLAVAFLSK